MKYLLNTELGARYRALLSALSALVVAVILFLQEVVNIGERLPDWGPLGAILAIVVGVISWLGRFTRLGGAMAPLPPAPADPAITPRDPRPGDIFD